MIFVQIFTAWQHVYVESAVTMFPKPQIDGPGGRAMIIHPIIDICIRTPCGLRRLSQCAYSIWMLSVWAELNTTRFYDGISTVRRSRIEGAGKESDVYVGGDV